MVLDVSKLLGVPVQMPRFRLEHLANAGFIFRTHLQEERGHSPLSLEVEAQKFSKFKIFSTGECEIGEHRTPSFRHHFALYYMRAVGPNLQLSFIHYEEKFILASCPFPCYVPSSFYRHRLIKCTSL